MSGLKGKTRNLGSRPNVGMQTHCVLVKKNISKSLKHTTKMSLLCNAIEAQRAQELPMSCLVSLDLTGHMMIPRFSCKKYALKVLSWTDIKANINLRLMP